jgi:hypothetical protein
LAPSISSTVIVIAGKRGCARSLIQARISDPLIDARGAKLISLSATRETCHARGATTMGVNADVAFGGVRGRSR